MPTTSKSLTASMSVTSKSSTTLMPTTSNSKPQVIKSGLSQITKNSTKWSRDATLFLIDQWKKSSSKFTSTTIRNEEVWKNIVKELENVGFTGYTWKQAEDKWKNIRKGYMKVKDNMGDKSSGAARVTCKFYDELDEIFRKSPSVEPISVASSHKSNNLPAVDSDSDSDKENLKYQSKKKKTKLQKETISMLSIFKDDANVREAARQDRHRETLDAFNRAIDSYEAQMQKLIDKL
ncbi:hypothetical protein ALC60_06429 [Trachymyrmex zeteki]|uniref:Myb/SANT-like DNA-binding domain-containing protein n=2 Tax=Mycetomoellerius zeteki TaxID=64791 RepID=A0A151X2N5_9HYME|nr:hypothetical protein ALC60_06429 [Trachymyrmex zeteki]